MALVSVAAVVPVVAEESEDDPADCNWMRNACIPDENCWSGLEEPKVFVVGELVPLASAAWEKPLKILPRAWSGEVLDEVVPVVGAGGAVLLWIPQLSQD